MTVNALQFPVPEEHSVLAAAVAGDTDALLRCVESEDLAGAASRHRLHATLALRARHRGIENDVTAQWARQLRHLAIQSMVFDASLEEIGSCLAEPGIEWTVLKGMDLASRVYDQPEERPAADIDLLIRTDDYPEARAALEHKGWKAMFPEPAHDRWVLEEGHAWAAVSPSNQVALELHLRLWGMLTETAGSDLMEASWPDPSLPAGGRRIPLAYAFVVGAIHCLLDAPARPLFQWRDLERIAARNESAFAHSVIGIARQWQVELMVALATTQVQSLWPSSSCGEIARTLQADLKWPERRVVARASRAGIDATGASLSLARLLSGRETRSGWGTVVRRFWAHPGVVAQDTPRQWSPARRRSYHLLKAVGLKATADRLTGNTPRSEQ